MISLADVTDYVQFAATGKNRFLERGTKVRWPWWSVRKASKMSRIILKSRLQSAG